MKFGRKAEDDEDVARENRMLQLLQSAKTDDLSAPAFHFHALLTRLFELTGESHERRMN